jgi:hypothetical protein
MFRRHLDKSQLIHLRNKVITRRSINDTQSIKLLHQLISQDIIILTIYVLFVMNEEFRHYLDLRMQYLAEGDATGELNPQAQHSLIVEALPRELRKNRISSWRYSRSKKRMNRWRAVPSTCMLCL